MTVLVLRPKFDRLLACAIEFRRFDVRPGVQLPEVGSMNGAVLLGQSEAFTQSLKVDVDLGTARSLTTEMVRHLAKRPIVELQKSGGRRQEQP